jgi:hypothetical protein
VQRLVRPDDLPALPTPELADALLHGPGIMAPLDKERNCLPEPAGAVPRPAAARLKDDAERLEQLSHQPPGAIPLGRCLEIPAQDCHRPATPRTWERSRRRDLGCADGFLGLALLERLAAEEAGEVLHVQLVEVDAANDHYALH